MKPNRLPRDRRLLRNALMSGLMVAALVAGAGLRPALAHGQHGVKNKGEVHRSGRADSAGDWRRSHHVQREVRAKLFTSAVVSGRRSARSVEGGSGIASVYNGGMTASGERMSAGGMTAAHRTLPFGTKVTVVNRRNGRSAEVRINDRGPFVRGRVIDLSPAAARVLGVSGLVPVSLTVGGAGETRQAREEE